MIKKIFSNQLFDLFLIAIIGLISITWFQGDFIIKAGDSSFSLAPYSDFIRYSYVWDPIFAMGKSNPLAVMSLPYFLFMAFLENLGLSIITSQKVYIYLIFTLSGLSMYYLSSILSKNNRTTAIVSSLFYMMNTYALTTIWGTGLISIIVTYAVFPLMLALYIKGLGTKNYKYIFLMILTQTIFSMYGINPAFSILIWIILYSYFVYFIIVEKDKVSVLFALKFTVMLTLLWVLVSLWWILPTLALIGEQYLSAQISGKPIDIFMGGSGYTSVLNVVRLLGAWTLYVRNFPDPYFLWSEIYFTTPFILMSFLPPIVAFTALLLKKTDKNVLYFSLLAIIFTFLLKGAQVPAGEVNIWLLENLPFAGAFRSHYEKLGLVLALSFAFLIGTVINELYSYSKSYHISSKRKTCSSIFLLIIFLISTVYTFPSWTGDVIYGGGDVIPSYRVKVPSYYYEANNWFSNKSGDYRMLYMPSLPSSGVAYDWESGYFGSDPLDEYFFQNMGIVGFGYSGNDVVDNYQQQITNSYSNNSRISMNILSLANIRYIILHNDFNLEYSSAESPNKLKMLLRSEQDIQLEKSIGKLDLYRVSDKYDLPHIYTTNKYTYTPNMESTFNIIKSPSFIPGDTVIITQNEVNVDKNAGLQYISEKDINNNITSASGYHTNIYFKKINPTKYKIKINNSTKPFFLVFSESYHPSWKAYISTGTKNGTWKQIADYENLNVTESQDEQKFFEIKDISQLVGKGVSDKNHFLVNGYANAWYINPEELNVNEDFTVTLYFKPQSYFYVGLIILGIIFIGILGYLYLEVRKKQKYGLGDLDEF